MSLARFLKPISTTASDYKRLKNTLKNSTAGYGSALSASYFITQGAEQGVSSYAWSCNFLRVCKSAFRSCRQVGEVYNSKEFFAPLSAAAFEVAWNNAPFAFDFDYGATFVGFLAYKFALTTVVYETVRDMMISDSDSLYDTEPKVYNDLSIGREQHGEIDITDEAVVPEINETHAMTRSI